RRGLSGRPKHADFSTLRRLKFWEVVTFDWGIKEGETAGTQIACDAERRECTANLTPGELDESDPLAIKCNNEFRKCMMSKGKGK
ncbi:hypothetical protein P3W33_15540, partial [Luteibacter sp. PPL552]